MNTTEGSESWISPSKSAATPKRENNENDQSQFKITPKSLNGAEKASKHHFMSPTISASSKVTPTRRKILSERNQNSFEPYSQSPDSKKSPINSSVKAYDPLTNRLTPRPKYLRFDPNRRMEISSRLDEEELSNDSFDSQEEVNDEETGDSCFGPIKEDVFKPENVEDDVEDEDEEGEVEEENGWNFKGMLKCLLVLIACVLSTSYICTMNSPTPTLTQQAILKVRDGYLMVKRQTLEAFGVKGQEGVFLEEADYDEFEGDGFFADDDGENEEITEGGIIEDGVDFDEDKNWEIEESVNVEAVEDAVGNMEVVGIDEVGNQKIVEDSEKFDNELMNEAKDTKDRTDEVVDVEGSFYVGQFEVFDQSVDVKTDGIVVNAEKIEDSDSGIDSGLGSHEQSDTEIKGSDQFHPEKSEFHVVENSDNLGQKTKAIIGVSLISVILASLGFVYHLKKSLTSSNSAETSEPVVLKIQKLEVEEKTRIEFLARPSSPLLQSTEEAPPQKLTHPNIYAPDVELLGEIDFGQMSRRSIRKHEADSELPQPVSTTTYQSTEEASPQKSRRAIRKHVAEPETPLPVSTTSSLSYGSSTKTKNLKKEGGKSGEFTAEGTPVRRSSRLKSRAAVGKSS